MRATLVMTGLVLLLNGPVLAETQGEPQGQAQRQAQGQAPAGQQRGQASFYHPENFTGRPMANGDRFDPGSNAAASRTLPLGTTAEVTNLRTGETREVVIEDRGPYVGGRIIDVSPRIAEELGMREQGVAPVEVRPTGRLPNSARDGRSGTE